MKAGLAFLSKDSNNSIIFFLIQVINFLLGNFIFFYVAAKLGAAIDEFSK